MGELKRALNRYDNEHIYKVCTTVNVYECRVKVYVLHMRGADAVTFTVASSLPDAASNGTIEVRLP